jgi:hypothetical protein
MIRPLRQALTLAVLAVHAAFVAGGAGLHALPGLAHAASTTLSGRAEAAHSPAISPATDDCPVCHFLAHGQVSLDAPEGPPSVVETDRCTVPSAPRVLVSRRLLTRLRAPPGLPPLPA